MSQPEPLKMTPTETRTPAPAAPNAEIGDMPEWMM